MFRKCSPTEMSAASVGVRSSSLSKFEVENIDNNKGFLGNISHQP